MSELVQNAPAIKNGIRFLGIASPPSIVVTDAFGESAGDSAFALGCANGI